MEHRDLHNYRKNKKHIFTILRLSNSLTDDALNNLGLVKSLHLYFFKSLTLQIFINLLKISLILITFLLIISSVNIS